MLKYKQKYTVYSLTKRTWPTGSGIENLIRLLSKVPPSQPQSFRSILFLSMRYHGFLLRYQTSKKTLTCLTDPRWALIDYSYSKKTMLIQNFIA